MFNNMTLYDFRASDEMEQIEAFWDGVLVGTCVKDEQPWECKQINDFYIEYRIEGGRFYRDMKCHKNTTLIEPYLGTESLHLQLY